ncbi:EIICB-Lac [Sebaldella termitidis]|uniref:PTS system lactose-specific EIICB component n=1 Tax=Sebaldella termitidis (strain ATCC 33386 / NCTC 11300) TaxID=526218 RepID=D1AQN7_SEBTE|nr:PTS lactose transporter subunit IIBC [Sebaldella termitidis]ACZ10297.1 PTS system, lactose/cellobiose family IIC subunit [Sebaldella termitidis ATCC 33386]SUI25636.1 EIICB-Lac [Sebaldella termitidis]
MMKLVKWITKMQPFFNKISNNPYLRAIRDGFISLIPVILFSSIFLLIAFVPNAFGYFLPDNIVTVLMKAYSLSMGILAILMSSTIARSLTDNFNLKMPKTRQINTVSVMIAAIISFLLLSTDLKDGAISLDYLGTKGLLTSFIIGFTIPNIYKFCVGRNITIKLPKEVPGNISQTFADIIPISLSVLFFWVFDILVRKFIGVGFSEFILELFRPLFSAADGYIGLAVIFGAMAFFWFVGIHGPSIVEPAVAAIYLTNVEVNFQMFSKGEHATKVLSQGSQYFVATLGGTGATLVIIFMMAFIAKSKQLKAVGKASLIPGLFGVNEPILFGAPLVLNPVFFIPFILTPIINVWLLKFFITLGMNGFVYNLPWTTPGPLGLIIGTGFSPLVFLLVPLLLAVDFVIYYPFLKTYDLQLIKQEEEDNTATERPKEEIKDEKIYDIKDKKISVLVLCANGATSGMLANAIAEGAKQKNMDLESTAMAYGQHKEVLDQFDLIILAPQMASMLDELKVETDKAGIKSVSTGGKEYVGLTRNPEEALKFALKNI